MMEGRGALRSPAEGPGTVQAVSVSTLIAPLFGTTSGAHRGVVVSVHASAVNLLIDGALVVIASARAGGLPNGLLVAEPFDPRTLGIRAGMGVTIVNGRLTIGDGRVRIAPGLARPWRPELRPVPTPRGLGRRAGIARGVALPGSGVHGIVPVGKAVAALADALATGAEPAIVEAGRVLVGLGAGLTPAGDDVLVGFTAGLTALGDGRARGLARAWAGHAVGRTTVVAESFHLHAAGGAYSERLHDVLWAILLGPVDGIPAAIRAAAAWGATSGADTLAGLLLALESTAADAELGAA